MYSVTEKELESRKTVLVVDDEEINRDILGLILQDDFNVEYATNGNEALSMMLNPDQVIDLVLLDILMPGMDGREILRLRQTNVDLKRIPIIVCTGESDIEIECFKLGVNDFITKPYNNPEIIIARIHRMIELYEDRVIIKEVKRDRLTNLFKPDFFIKYAEKFDLKYSDKEKDMLSIRIYHLDLVQELYGKEYGREVIKDIGKYLKNYATKFTGIVGKNADDSFLIYCFHQDDYSTFMSDLIDHVQKNFSSTIRINIGVYPKVDPKIDKELIIHRVESSHDKLKDDHGYSMAVYDEKEQAKAVYNEKLIHSFDAAINDGEFVVYYQPKYNIQGNEDKLISAEALVRWMHPEFGFISPGDFIPLFEENGMIHRLDEYVLDHVVEQVELWFKEYGVYLPVSINLSRVDLFDPNLVDEVNKKVDAHHIPHDKIYLEITESAYSENTSQVMDVANEFKKYNYNIEVDDFGSGYSSLSVLTELNLDVIKIDMSFIRNLNKNPHNKTIVKMIVDISKMIDAVCVAEGVESEEQYQFLKEIGCGIIQGYYFSKALPASEMGVLIKKELVKE